MLLNYIINLFNFRFDFCTHLKKDHILFDWIEHKFNSLSKNKKDAEKLKINFPLRLTLKGIGRKGLEPLTASAIEFTVQPVIPTNGTFLFFFILFFNFNQSRAISTTRTVFRLNTNWSHAYENYLPEFRNFFSIKNQQEPNLLRILLSAPDEWLVPIWDKIHRDVITHDY